MSDPIRIIAKARNNRLMEIREQMGLSCREMAEYIGISYCLYLDFEGLKKYPGKKTLKKMTDKLGSAAAEAFPDYLRTIEKRVSWFTVPESEMLRLADVPRRELPQECEFIKEEKSLDDTMAELFETLTSTEADILRARFGLEGSPETLEEIARKMGVQRERVRQIEAKALRKMRHPSRSVQLRQFRTWPERVST